MKNFFYYGVLALFSCVFFSCNNDESFDPVIDEVNTGCIVKNGSEYLCDGCIPRVHFYHDKDTKEFYLEWATDYGIQVGHPICFTCKVRDRTGQVEEYSNSDVYETRTYFLDENSDLIGTDAIKMGSVSSYIVEWEIMCLAEGCEHCSNSGVFSHNYDPNPPYCPGILQDFNLVPVGYDRFWMKDEIQEDFNPDNENVLKIDCFRTYNYSFYYGWVGIFGGSFSYDPDTKKRYVTLPYYEKSLSKNYRVEFYSSECPNNKEHYIAYTYGPWNDGIVVTRSKHLKH